MLRKIIALCAIVLPISFFVSCKKESKPVSYKESAYEKYKDEIDNFIYLKQHQLQPVYLINSPSWTSNPAIPIPVFTKYLYTNSEQSPLGSGYIRFHFQMDVDNATKQYLSSNKNTKRLEFRYHTRYMTGSNTGWRVYTPNGLRASADWPRCYYIDVQQNNGTLTFPDFLTGAIVSSSGTSGYSLNGNGKGWNGLFDFSTTATFSISQANGMDFYLGAPLSGVCPK